MEIYGIWTLSRKMTSFRLS